MCFNPRLLLCKTVFYKGYSKKLLYWNTTLDDYERGYVEFNNLNKPPSKLCSQMIKYGVTSVSTNGDYVVIEPIRFDERIEIPCRKCLECTRLRSQEWSIRCELEALKYDCNYFVTLTYNNKYIRSKRVTFIGEDGLVNHRYVYTLCKKDTIDFMKLLRQIFKRDLKHEGIRFFLCGEYGTATHRPHYHCILFNCPFDDLSIHSTSKTGYPIYRSKKLERAWKYGFCTVQNYSIECARYVAQYCCKKLLSKYHTFDIESEFINMSRRNGIGCDYIFENVDKIYRIKDEHLSPKIFSCSVSKSNDYKQLAFPIPKAFERYFQPITDIKRNLDNEDGIFRGIVATDLTMCYDNYLFKKVMSSVQNESNTLLKMQKYGFKPEDRYTRKYLDYLKILEYEMKRKFKIVRNC